MHRRCNYDRDVVNTAQYYINMELNYRDNTGIYTESDADGKLAYYIEQWKRSTMADAVILPYISSTNAQCIPQELLQALETIIASMLAHKPFELVTIHDAFASHPNNCNAVRQHYINIFAELAESDLLSDLLNQLHNTSGGKYAKLSNNLGDLIRKGAYALC
jgi:hypothetical protein